MTAPEKFVQWLNSRRHVDRRYGHVFRYHPRSNSHSITLCECVLQDLLENCGVLIDQARKGLVAYGIDLKHVWQTSNKAKTIDLAVGIPGLPIKEGVATIGKVTSLDQVLISCEAKSCMTEHGKSQPRIYDELSSSHEIVHQGRQDAIAAGITIVNIAPQFASPLRQTSRKKLHFSNHTQPRVTANMVEHLRGLPLRERVGDTGFDAYSTIVVNCDNIHGAALWRDPPAPQPGDSDHYDTFLERISRLYAERFADLK